eukprot:gene20666-21345_t
MAKTNLHFAISTGIFSISDRDLTKNLDILQLVNDLNLAPGKNGAIALLQGDGSYDLRKYTGPQIQVPTLDDLWRCTKENFAWSAGTAALAYGGMPVTKESMGHKVIGKASKYTNRISAYGTKYYPRYTLTSGTPVAKLSRALLGTTRVFGIIGRGTLMGAIGFAVFDVLLDADLTTELKIASDDLSIFAMDLEKHFDMRLTQNEWGRINTLRQAVDLVMEYRGVKLSQNSPEPGFWGKLWDCI